MAKRNILVPLDQSKYSEKILPQIEKFIQPMDTQIVLFHVSDEQLGIDLLPATDALHYGDGLVRAMPSKGQMPRPASHSIQEEDSIRNKFEVELLSVANHLRKAGFEVSVEVYFGDPKKEILNIIVDKKIDMVAMTTHARTGLGKFVFGSVADHILHHVSIPILMIHPS